jgi:hypothetical protein
MNYARIYAAFIDDRKAKQPQAPDYFEKHHIKPRCLGGGDEPENIIRLTVEDHIHAHILLAKIHGGKLWGAVLFMTKRAVGRGRKSRVPTKAEQRAAAFGKRMFAKWNRGENHPHFGKLMSAGSRAKMSAAQKRRAEQGLHWAQQKPHLISGANSWMKKPENAGALARAIPKFTANLEKAVAANMGAANVMHRPEVKEKIRESQRRHWVSGTGPASPDARQRFLDAHRSESYLAGARARVSGEKNPMHGKTHEQNPNSRAVLCVETGRVFGSVKEAVKFCGGDVTKAARTGGMAGGFHWKRLTAHASDGRITKHESQAIAARTAQH